MLQIQKQVSAIEYAIEYSNKLLELRNDLKEKK